VFPAPTNTTPSRHTCAVCCASVTSGPSGTESENDHEPDPAAGAPRWRIRGDPSDWRSWSGVRAAGRDENWAHPTARSIVSRNTECPSYRSDRSITRALIGCAGESPFDRDAATFLVAEFAKPFSASRGLSHGEHANSIHFHAFCASLTSGATTMRPPMMALNASRSHHRLT
jgi:hypothetical protein